ncbi:MAG: hypothetical protein WBQ69_00450 [Gallionella sp.]
MNRSGVLMLAFVVGACSSLLIYMPPRYSVSDDNAKAIKRFGGGHINVGPFTMAEKFNNDCGITAGSVRMPDKLSFEGYIRQGLIDELKNAGMFDDVAPKITLSGTVEQLSVFSRRNIFTSTWKVGLRVDSSNGQSVSVTEHYNFDVGFGSNADCQKIADAYMPMAQKILAKFINAPEFRSLITP